jgi:hypothetical protein
LPCNFENFNNDILFIIILRLKWTKKESAFLILNAKYTLKITNTTNPKKTTYVVGNNYRRLLKTE